MIDASSVKNIEEINSFRAKAKKHPSRNVANCPRQLLRPKAIKVLISPSKCVWNVHVLYDKRTRVPVHVLATGMYRNNSQLDVSELLADRRYYIF